MARRKINRPAPVSPFWLQRRGNRQRTHEGRGATRLEQAREDLMQDWFGADLAPGEILARQHPAQPVSAAVNEVIHDLATQRIPLLDQLQLEWPAIVGSDLARATAPVSFRGKTLNVEVKNATLQYILERERKAEITEAARAFSGGLVAQIRFVPGGRRRFGG
jgi:hypothetical protein